MQNLKLRRIRSTGNSVLRILIVSMIFASPAVTSPRNQACIRTPRNPLGATELPQSQMFLVDESRIRIALRRLHGREFLVLSNHDAASYVHGLRARSNHRNLLVRAGVATGGALPLGTYYQTARQTLFVALWHPRDRHLEVASLQGGREPFTLNAIAFIVQTELPIRSASAVCYALSEGPQGN
jgi:hypothetical protein